MHKVKKVLVMFHYNFLKRDMGASQAVYIPVKILKSFGFSIDFFTISKFDDFSNIAFI